VARAFRNRRNRSAATDQPPSRPPRTPLPVLGPEDGEPVRWWWVTVGAGALLPLPVLVPDECPVLPVPVLLVPAVAPPPAGLPLWCVVAVGCWDVGDVLAAADG
jgi:hypothetical protein